MSDMRTSTFRLERYIPLKKLGWMAAALTITLPALGGAEEADPAQERPFWVGREVKGDIHLAVVDGWREIHTYSHPHVPSELLKSVLGGEQGECGRGLARMTLDAASPLPGGELEVVFNTGHFCEPSPFTYDSTQGQPYLVLLTKTSEQWSGYSSTKLLRLDDGSLVIWEPRFIYLFRLESLLEEVEFPAGYEEVGSAIPFEKLLALHEQETVDWYDLRLSYNGRPVSRLNDDAEWWP